KIIRDHSRITRRSLPHGGFVDIDKQNELALNRTFFDPIPLISGLKEAGYEVLVVLTVRDHTIAVNSKYREHTQQHLEVARTEMDRAVSLMNDVLVSHEQCFVCC